MSEMKANHAHLMQYTPLRPAHRYGDKVSKQEVRGAVDVSTDRDFSDRPPKTARAGRQYVTPRAPFISPLHGDEAHLV